MAAGEHEVHILGEPRPTVEHCRQSPGQRVAQTQGFEQFHRINQGASIPLECAVGLHADGPGNYAAAIHLAQADRQIGRPGL